MKIIKYTSIIPVMLGVLIQGCGHLNSPLAPVSNPGSASPAAMTAPQFTSAFPVGDPANSYLVGLAYDPSQNVLYTTDTNLNLVYKYSPNGALLGEWGDRGTVTLDQPQGAIVHNGNLYVADAGNSRIVEYDPTGTVIATLQPRDGQFYLFIYPTGLFFDAQGDLYVADNSDMIYQFDQNLILTGQFNGGGKIDFPSNACEDGNGNIYVANYNADQILKLRSNGTLNTSWGQTGSGAGQFNGPYDVKLDPKGNINVVDSLNDRIETFDANGNFLAQWGPSSNAEQSLSEPNGMTFDANGHIYVVDSGNSRIVEYTPSN